MAGKKDISKLVKKVITDKNGISRSVWVKIVDNTGRKYKRSQDLTSNYKSNLTKVNRDMNPQSPDYKEATALKLIMLHGIRVGNENSAEGFERHKSKEVEKTYGLLTLKKEHFTFTPNSVILNYKGKKSVDQYIQVKDKSLRDAIKHFYSKTKGDGAVLGMTNYELRKYINKNIDPKYSPKDFRTMKANLEAKTVSDNILKRKTFPKTKAQMNAEIREILEHVSNVLGNTKGVAKKSYVDDFILMEHITNRLKQMKKQIKTK